MFNQKIITMLQIVSKRASPHAPPKGIVSMSNHCGDISSVSIGSPSHSVTRNTVRNAQERDNEYKHAVHEGVTDGADDSANRSGGQQIFIGIGTLLYGAQRPGKNTNGLLELRLKCPVGRSPH